MRRVRMKTVCKKIRRNYFSLIELLITISIIAILAGVLLPALNSARKKAISISCIGNQKNTGMFMSMYADTYDDWMIPPRGPVPEVESRWSDYIVEYSQHKSIDSANSFAPENIKSLRMLRCPALNFVGKDTYSYAKHTANQVFGMNLHLFGGYAFSGALITRRAVKRSRLGREKFSDGNCCIPYAAPAVTVLFADTIRYYNGGYTAYLMFGGDYSYATMVHGTLSVNVSMLDGHSESASLSKLRREAKFIPDEGSASYGQIFDLDGNIYK